MTQTSGQLKRELKFIEDSLRSGIITKQEYDVARQRVEQKLSKIVEEERVEVESKSQMAVSEPEEITQQEPVIRKESVQPFRKEPLSHHKEPEAKPLQPEQVRGPRKLHKPGKLNLETYGGQKPFPKKFMWFGLFLIIIIIVIFYSMGGDVQTGVPVEEEFVPVCSMDLECQQANMIGKCVMPGTQNASCSFTPATLLSITVLNEEECALCDATRMKNTLTQLYPGARFVTVDAFSTEGSDLVDDLDIEVLPAFVFGEEVEATGRFEATRSTLIQKGDKYVFKPGASGASYFFARQEITGTVELFLNPSQDASLKALENIIALSVKYPMQLKLSYLVDSRDDDELCLKETEPARLLDYLSCLDEEDTSCLDEYSVQCDGAEIILKTDQERANDFAINTVPVFVFNNQYKKGGSLSVDLLEDAYCSVNGC